MIKPFFFLFLSLFSIILSTAAGGNANKTGIISEHRKRGIMARRFVDEHNKVRVPLGLTPMVWDRKVARYARQYGWKVASSGCVMKHSMGPYGENLCMGGGDQWTPAIALQMWTSEAPDYDVRTNTCKAGKVCGHYTQVVWNNSVRLGCDQARCPSGNLFVICSYDPPGNYIGTPPY